MQRYFIQLVRPLILIVLYQVKLPTHKIKKYGPQLSNNPLKINIVILKEPFKSVSLTLRKLCIITLFMLGFGTSSQAQYLSLSTPRELSIGGGLLIVSGMNWYLSNQYPTQGHAWKIRGLDNFNRTEYKEGNAKLSDLSFVSTAAAAALVGFALPKQQRFNYGVILTQNVWMTANIVQFTKVMTGRNRPYIQGTGPIMEEGKDNYYSFFSGHSAISASLATTALVATYKNYRSESFTWGKATAITGAALAVTTGILRISAGKHYPSDVITGLAVGAGVSLLNMVIHEKH